MVAHRSYWSFRTDGNASNTKTDTQLIIGSRDRLGIGHHWFMPLYVDYGGSGDLTTYQWVAGIAHEYHSGAQILAWRQLAYFQNADTSELLQDIHIGGLTVAWSFYL